MAFTKIAAAGIGSTETVTLDGLSVINDASFNGNVSVGGTLTYEDVTNIDSVGLITARAGVVVGSGITLSKDGDIFATGVTTATSFVGDGSQLTGVASTDNIRTNTNATFLQNINVSGTVTATSYSGSGANLTNIDSGMFIKTSAGIHTIGDQSNVGIGTTNPASGLDVSLKTDGIALPEGTTSQRPSGSQKFIRFNSTTGSLELYNGNQWVEILSDYSQTGSTALG